MTVRLQRASSRVGLLCLAVLMGSGPVLGQRVASIDVQHYVAQLRLTPATQNLEADVVVRFLSQEDGSRYVSFQLHNDLQLNEVTDEKGSPVQFSRSYEDFTVRLVFDEPLRAGQLRSLRFRYTGRLTGREESPVAGITFAALDEKLSYLMYPARWLPISGYTTDRFTMELRVTVPKGYKVLASGTATAEPVAGDELQYRFEYTQPSFPASLAVVQQEGVPVEAEGVRTTVYFRPEHQELATAFGTEVGRAMAFLSRIYGAPPDRDLLLIESGPGAPNGYAAPGMIFLASNAIRQPMNTRLLVNQVARQWWGVLVSAGSRDHLWLINGPARYSEILWIEQEEGPSTAKEVVQSNYVEALTVDEIPLAQSSRLEDYSPEFWAATAGKGVAILNMLRWMMGEDAFRQLLRAVPEEFAWKSLVTDDFRQLAEKISGQDLRTFFIQWFQSSGAPTFDIEYTVYRTQKGFRVMGKLVQDLDTFRMPLELEIQTEGNPERKVIEVVGPSTDFVVDTFGKPTKVIIDPDNRVLRYDDKIRVLVAIRRGEQLAEVGEFVEALKQYQKALDVNRYSSLAHYRIGEVFFLQRNYQAAANEFREALNGDLDPKWTEVWSHINLGRIFDITGQRERAVNEYNLALRTKDNTGGALEVAARYLQEPYRGETSDSSRP